MSDRSSADVLPDLPVEAREAVARGWIQGLADADRLAGLDDQALVTAARTSESVGRLVDAGRLFVAGVMADRSRKELGGSGSARSQGAKDPVELIARTTGASPAEARRRLLRSAPLQPARNAFTGEDGAVAFPLLRAAVTTGLMPADMSAAVTTPLAPLLERACSTVGEFLQVLPPARPQRRAPGGERAQREEQRSVSLSQRGDGLWDLRGVLVEDTAAQLMLLRDAVLNPKRSPGEQRTPCVDEDGNPVGLVDHRSGGRRFHDALTEVLATTAASVQAGTLHGGNPTLVITCSVDHLDEEAGLAFLQGTHDEATSVVDVSIARHAGCVGTIHRLLTTREGAPLSMATLGRVFTSAQREAIALRDGGCCWPGCEVPSGWVEIHHVREWATGGRTTVDNGISVCFRHHRDLEGPRLGGRDARRRAVVPAPAGVDPAQVDSRPAVRPRGVRPGEAPSPRVRRVARPRRPESARRRCHRHRRENAPETGSDPGVGRAPRSLVDLVT